ncbi:MAG: DJ-1/PfpI family protein [Sediminicola sp.]
MFKRAIFVSVFLVRALLISQEPAKSDNTYVCPPCNAACDSLTFQAPGLCSHCSMPLVSDGGQNIAKPTIAFYLQSGVEVLDFAGPMEVFSYAGYKVFTVSKTTDPIISQGILKVVPEFDIQHAPKADILAFFGGNSGEAKKDRDVIDWVRSQNEVQYYFSVCTGAFILAEAGLLNGKTVTTFHDALDDLERDYPETKVVKNVRFVDNGSIMTTAGISAGIDGALHLVAKISGFNTAREAAYYMEYDKWVPGEGLLLSDDDPYKNLESGTFKEYTGTYGYLDGGEIKVKVNQREKSLYAVLNDRNYPLFHMHNDTFSTLSGDTITFKRNAQNKVSGYSTTKDTRTYAKLDK